MRTTLPALALTLLLLTAGLASAQADMPAKYPSPVEELVRDMVEEAPDTAWPSERATTDQARTFLERANRSLERGQAGLAMENYVLFHVTNAGDHLLEDLREQSPQSGRAQADNVTTLFEDQAWATSQAARESINSLPVANLTVHGAEVALVGAILVARGELQLNYMDQLRGQDLYDGRSVNEDRVRGQVGAALGGQMNIALGLSLASLAPRIGGPTLEPGELQERLSDLANRSVPLQKGSGLEQYVPRGSPSDSALLRAGLLFVTVEESKTLDLQRTYGLKGGQRNLTQQVEKTIAFDRSQLAPWSQTGSPVGLFGIEGITVDGTSEFLNDPARRTFVRAHATALTAHELLQVLHPEAFEEQSAQEAPVPGLAVSLTLLSLLALGTRRRRW